MYTLERLQQMDDRTLEQKARMIMQAYGAGFYPCTNADHSYLLERLALDINHIDYVSNLCVVASTESLHHLNHLRDAAKLLQVTPKERTQAALLTIQWRRNADIVRHMKMILGRA